MKNSIPNFLTLSRLIVMPVSLALLMRGRAELAFFIYCLIAVSDFLDGYFARKWACCSSFGLVLDQVSDKLVGLGFFSGLWIVGLCPVWFFALILSVTVLLGLGFLIGYFLRLGNSPQTSLPLGKWNMAFQYVWVGWLIFQEAWVGGLIPGKLLSLFNLSGFIILALLQIKVFMDYGVRWLYQVFRLSQNPLERTRRHSV